jgi:hypothetical protein
MMFPQFGSEATIGAFMEIEHEHSREIIEIFSLSRALQRTSPLAAILIQSRMWASDESMRAQPGLFDIDERLKQLSDLNDQSLLLATATNVATFLTE